jgi:high-affinity iron transporter
LPFITVLREGLEAVVFVAGVGLSEPASAFPLPAITGLLAGSLIGYVIYRGGVTFRREIHLDCQLTALLYLVAAGLLSKGRIGSSTTTMFESFSSTRARRC